MQVVAAERLLKHWQCLMVLVEGLLKLPLLSKHSCNIHLCHGQFQVVRAIDFQHEIEGLLVHCQGFLWLTLLVEHDSNAAQPPSGAQKY